MAWPLRASRFRKPVRKVDPTRVRALEAEPPSPCHDLARVAPLRPHAEGLGHVRLEHVHPGSLGCSFRQTGHAVAFSSRDELSGTVDGDLAVVALEDESPASTLCDQAPKTT